MRHQSKRQRDISTLKSRSYICNNALTIIFIYLALKQWSHLTGFYNSQRVRFGIFTEYMTRFCNMNDIVKQIHGDCFRFSWTLYAKHSITTRPSGNRIHRPTFFLEIVASMFVSFDNSRKEKMFLGKSGTANIYCHWQNCNPSICNAENMISQCLGCRISFALSLSTMSY